MSELTNNEDVNIDELVIGQESTEDIEISLSNEDLVNDVVEAEPEVKTASEEVAEELNISASITEVPETVAKNVIGSAKPKGKRKPALGSVNNGAIGASSVEVKEGPKKTTKLKEEPAAEKVAVFSTKNVTWNGVGKVYRGYNIVTKDQADKWLNRDHIRLATPEEVAKEFGVN